MLNVFDIITAAREQTEESMRTYPDSLMLTYINMALADLTPVAKIVAFQEGVPLNINGVHATVPSPPTAHEIVAVYYVVGGTGRTELLRQLPLQDPVSRGWQQVSNMLRLRNLGTIPPGSTCTIDFYRRLVRVVSVTDVPDLSEQYRNLLVLYCCAKIQERAAVPALKTDFLGEYLATKQQFAMQRILDVAPHSLQASTSQQSRGNRR